MPKPKLNPRQLEVLDSTRLTPHMVRVTLGGAALEDFPEQQESAYVKLLYPQEGSDHPLTRTYTIARQRPGEIDLDFVLHEDSGPASAWAASTRPGDRIQVGGPGPRKLINPDGDWFLIAGDMTALPAIRVNLASLPADARGHAVLEVLDEGDITQLPHPEGVSLHWVVNPEPGGDDSALVRTVRDLPWDEGEPAIWAACEFGSMRALRRYFRQERGVDRMKMYVSSYWKQGQSEDEHKVIKRRDADAEG